MEFKDRLKQLREEKNLSQKDCAAELSIDYANYNKYEKGICPNFETLIRIGKYFNVSTDYLLAATEIKSPEIEIQAMCDKLGLTEKSVEVLQNIQEWIKAVQNNTPINIPHPYSGMFEDIRRIKNCNEELDALNLLIAHGFDFGFFRTLWNYLFMEYFSEGENNPTNEGDTIMEEIISSFSGKEPRRIKGVQLKIKADTPNGERDARLSVANLNAAHRIELMDILAQLKITVENNTTETDEQQKAD